MLGQPGIMDSPCLDSLQTYCLDPENASKLGRYLRALRLRLETAYDLCAEPNQPDAETDGE